jgi:hypothetical protein
MTEADDRWLTCLHEASHFVADLLLRGEVASVISARAAEAHRGVTLGKGERFYFTGDDPLGVDPAFRQQVERVIVGLLAGQAAEALAGLPIGRFEEPKPAGDQERAAALAQSLSDMSPRDVELLRAAERRPPPDTSEFVEGDDRISFELAWRLSGQEAMAYLAWLTAVAERFVHRQAVAIVAVAREVEAKTVLPGSEGAAIVARVQKEVANDQPSTST